MKKLLFVFLLLPFGAFAQEYLRLNLSEDGKTYLKGSVRATFWGRYYQMNPNSTINGEPVTETSDFSIRRLRINFQGQITPKWFFYSAFGGNNFNFTTDAKTAKIGVLDLYTEYEFAPEFTLGIGKFGWNSSRNTMRSSKSMMGLDALSFPLFNSGKNDDNGRNLGLFAKGQIENLSYVFTLKSPLATTTEPKEGVVDYAKNSPRKQYSAHLKYDFWERESNKTTYTSGTYIGQKKIFNLALGGVFQSKMMSELQNNEVKYYDYKNFSAEIFLDTPLSDKNNAITLNTGYYYSDFGRNYIRNSGSNGVAGVSSNEFLNGAGTAYPLNGTGSTFFFQCGYLFGKSQHFSARIQPNISVQYSNFDGLETNMLAYDLGLNIFFKGHDNKLSLSYQNRPIYNQTKKVDSRKGAFIIQYQIQIN
ncbi:MAG: porin [Capnocytophaga sp.]|nr:porin [Capnocytophaga sp.]